MPPIVLRITVLYMCNGGVFICLFLCTLYIVQSADVRFWGRNDGTKEIARSDILGRFFWLCGVCVYIYVYFS